MMHSSSNRMIRSACALWVALGVSGTIAAAAGPGRLTIEHYFQLNYLSDPQISPGDDWIAYAITRYDLEEDESRERIWMSPVAGGEAVAMTAEDESSSQPRWSPDGKYLAFLSARDDGKTQVWMLDRRGGEAVQTTNTAQSVKSFDWSPDSQRLLLVLQDATPEELQAREEGDDYEEKTPGPWVIDREQFKRDYIGYLDRRRDHIYVLDISSEQLSQLTFGDYDDATPASCVGSVVPFFDRR